MAHEFVTWGRMPLVYLVPHAGSFTIRSLPRNSGVTHPL